MKNLIALALLAAFAAAVYLNYDAATSDCFDGKTDDCTAAWSLAHKPKSATCSLTVNGETLWDGRCYVKEAVRGIHAEAHNYRCHADGGPNKCTREEACAGPWINLTQESDGSYSSYWAIEAACHGGDPVNGIQRTGSGAYRESGFVFTVK